MRPDCLDRRIYRETFRAYLLAHAPRSGHGLRTIDADLILAARAAADVAEAKAFRLPGSTGAILSPSDRNGHGLVRG